VTRYELFRKRIAPVLFLGMVALIAYDACQKEERTHTTIVLDFGDEASEVREVDAQLFSGGELIGKYYRTAPAGQTIGPCSFETALPTETVTLEIQVQLDKRHRSITRTLRPIEGSTTTVKLGDELR
jgi:hypothetical protein